MVNIKSKQNFLNFLMETFLEKEDELNWFLRYLRDDIALLEKCHFIEDVNEVPRGLFLNFSSFKKQVILLKDEHFYLDLPQIFHEVRLRKKEILYIEVKFLNRWKNPLYLEVLEDNPYAPWNSQMNGGIEKEVTKAFLKEELKALNEKLDLSLEQGDQKGFDALAKRLNELKKESLSNDS